MIQKRQKNKGRDKMKEILKKISNIRYISEYWLMVAFLLLFALQYFMPVKQVFGESMLPTMTDRSTHYTIKTKDVNRGDIIAIEREGENELVKRLIGLPGDKITINKTHVIVNGEVLDEPYLSDELQQAIKNKESIYLKVDHGTVVVPEGHVFVLGDNRTDSLDSRTLGAIPMEVVSGKYLSEVKVEK